MTTIYEAPLRDIKFVLEELIGVEQLAELPGYEEATPDQIEFLLGEAANICETLLFPLNSTGDEEGCTLENGEVRTPDGFKEAYQTFIEAGWTALSCDPEYGGMGLPKLLNLVLEEMLSSSNLSLSIYPALTAGAYNAVRLHGSEELKDKFLPRLVDGTWTGTMCLTESHSGTDLGLVRTKAEPREDGSYLLRGNKIFITAGDQDFTENIIHLVLARLPDAPPGIKGISLFLVPKYRVNDDGSLGEWNDVTCGSLEKKMGIKGSSTCELSFDGSVGYLVGEKHRGMRHMFTMMNQARLGVGMQGLGLGEVSYQNGLEYAKTRLQGRALTGPKYPEEPADPLIVHPDVRRMLLTMKAYNEGNRALAYWTGLNLDLAEKHPDPEVREEADDLVGLLTPVVKAFFTDISFDVTNLAVQIYGGHGYIRETGVEQYVRDARIGQIYEGANGIQGLDLVGRKMGLHTGRLLRRFFHPVAAFLQEHGEDPAMEEFIGPLAKSFGKLQQTTAWIAEKGMADPEEGAAAATDYLRMFGLVAVGFMWARMAKVSLERLENEDLEEEDKVFYRTKLATARFYCLRLLPQTSGLAVAAMAGADTVMSLEDEAF